MTTRWGAMNVQRALRRNILKPVTFANFCDVMAAVNKYWALVELP